MDKMGERLIEWIDDYLKRSGDDYIIPENFTINEHGFATYRIDKGKVIILNCYGEGKFWDGFFQNLARKHGCKKVIFATKRNPKAFERKYGYRVVGYIMEKGVD